MKKTFIFLFLLLFIKNIYAEIQFDNNLTFGPSNYFSYNFDISVSRPETGISFGGFYSQSNEADRSYNFYITPEYTLFPDLLSCSLEYSFLNSTTYYEYKSTIETWFTSSVWSIPLILTENNFEAGLSLAAGPADFSLNASVSFQNLTSKLITEGSYKSTWHIITEQNFTNIKINPGTEFELPADFSVWLGGEKNIYNIDISEMLDYSGTTLTAARQSLAIKNGVQFNDYSLSAGISKNIFSFTPSFTYTYTTYLHSSLENSNDYSHSFSFYIDYRPISIISADINYEYIKNHYTDNSFDNSNYFSAGLSFYFKRIRLPSFSRL